ncbi:kinectin isoform X6 [Erythrolamprus reginae]|uniref:kinectin isoform X6 n=1 Tax=Erythrolamprus reginae TaxID=121349 RepID=UPI00396C79D0
MEFYESPYFIILVPSVVIAVIFLFFWLFMKETLYDEALAKQKRDQKILPSKTDKKKAEKKKSKKKEAQNGNLHESDSESTSRDLRLSDALGSEEEQIVPLPLNVIEAPSSLRERKKKEKKHKSNSEEFVPKELESSKPAGKKVEPVPVTKQPTPPSDSAGSKKKSGQKKQKNGIDDQDAKSDSLLSTSRKQDPFILHPEIKQESVSGKKKMSAKKQKTDNDSSVTEGKREAADLVRHDGLEGLQKTSVKKLKNETDKENVDVKFKDFILVMKNMIFTEEEAMNVVELLKEKSNAIYEILQKASKGDPVAMLHQLQEKDKLLMAAKEEGAVAKEQCKQLSQELMAEKERSNLVMGKMRERVNTLEKEHGVFQNKIHGGYQENQQMKMKFQQLREQMEAEISRLKQENGILRDAVSTSSNQMESKQSSELSKLHQDCARLVNELTEKNNKLQQEELVKKNAEQAINQLKAQQQEAERRWEEMQSYLRKRTAEHEAAQQDVQNKLVAKDNEIQSLHSKLTDTMVSKQQLEQRMMQLMEAEQKRVTTEDSIQRQVQNSASALTEELHKVIAEKDQQINQSEESLANERLKLTSKEEDLMVVQNINMSLKAEVQKLQAFTNDQVVAIRELERVQKSVQAKDDKIRTLEDQLQGHYSKASDAKEELQELEDQNKTLQLEIQKLQAVLSEQANKELLEQLERSITDKDDKIKTVEELLETGLIEMANKEEELKALRTDNLSLKSEVESLRKVQTEQVSFASLVEDLQRVISEKDGRIKSVEELLQAEVLKVATKEKTLGALEQEIEAVKEELRKAQLEKDTQVIFGQDIEDLQKQLKEKEERVKNLEILLKEKESEISKNVECLQVSVATSLKDHEAILREKQEEVQEMATLLDERGKEVAHQRKELQAVQEENRLLRAQIQEIKQENSKQESVLIRNEQLAQLISGKEQENISLQNELGSLKLAVEQQRQKNNDLRKKNWKAMEALASTEKLLQDRVNKTAKESQQHAEAVEAEMRNILQKLFPIVSLPSTLSHSEWMRGFEKAIREHTKETSRSDDIKIMEQKLKEADELHVMLQQECEKYKVVLAETEGILQRLQRSVEEEESKWKIKIEETQKELQQLKKEREHLEHELEKAEIERSTYVSEVRELKDLLTELQRKLDDSYSEAIRQNEELTLLKTQLNETSSKLLTDLNERHQLAADLPKAQESLVILEREIGKTNMGPEVIQNSDVCSQTAGPDNVNLIQDIVHLKQLLASVGQMLTKGKEQYQLLDY